MHWREFSLAKWLWYWLFVQASLVQILSRSYISAVCLFICFFVMILFEKMENIVEKKGNKHLVIELKFLYASLQCKNFDIF